MTKIELKNNWLIDNIEPCDWSDSRKYKNYLAICTISEDNKEEKAFLPDTKDTDKYFDVTDVEVDNILCASCWNNRKSIQSKVYYVVTEKTDDYIELDEYTTFRKALNRDKMTRKEKIVEEQKDLIFFIDELTEYGYCKKCQNDKELYYLHQQLIRLLVAGYETANTLRKDRFFNLLYNLNMYTTRYIIGSFNKCAYEKNPEKSEMLDFIKKLKKVTKLVRNFYHKNGYVEEKFTNALNTIINIAQTAEKDEKMFKSLEKLRIA